MAEDIVQCRKCRTRYRLAELGELVLFMAVEPWEKGLCAACEIEPMRYRGR